MQTVIERQIHSGLLFIRLGIAASLFTHAVPRLIDGAQTWRLVGGEMPFSHPDLPAHVVGLVVLVVQSLAGLSLLTGYFFRMGAVLLTLVYSLYFFNFVNVGYKTLPLYAGALACVCIGLLLSGPGRFAVSVKIESK
ncbi:MAG: hypothetical protein HKP58_07305 [Desulfatitalea sp.]|nr:hypothetical protein [Desulfatitalea sp.]NNK00205.1 hypothetical protein [Desulfatitalea sp.]